MEPIELVEAIEMIRIELNRAMAQAIEQEEQIQFEVGEITLEFQVVVERTGNGKVGVKFFVLDLESGVSKSSAATHTVTIPLKPSLKSGQPVLTGSGKIPS